jgi:hypothetical protein
MSAPRLVLAALAVAVLTGCGHPRPVTARVAAGFVELRDDARYDFRAVAPEGIAVAARAVPHEGATEVAFWERAITLRMRELDGYALVSSADVTGPDGEKGRELVFGHDEEGKPYVYRVRLFIERDRLLVVEVGGSREQMDRFAQSVAWMLGQIRLR